MGTLRPGECGSVLYLLLLDARRGVGQVLRASPRRSDTLAKAQSVWLTIAGRVKPRRFLRCFWPATKSATGDRVSKEKERQRHIITTLARV